MELHFITDGGRAEDRKGSRDHGPSENLVTHYLAHDPAMQVMCSQDEIDDYERANDGEGFNSDVLELEDFSRLMAYLYANCNLRLEYLAN